MKRSIVFAVLAALFYALSSPVSKLLLERMGPTMLAGLLYLGAGVGLLGLRLASRGRFAGSNETSRFSRGDLPFLVSMILLDIAAPILLLLGLRTTTAANVSLLNNFEIVATAIIALALFRERISRQLWAGVASVTTACMILSVEDLSSFSFSYGSLFVLAATLCWGLENNCTRRLSDRDPMITTIIKGFGSGLGSLAIALILGERCGSLAVLSAALALGFVAYGLSIWLYIRAQRDLGAARTSAYYALAPFMGAFLSFVLLSEMPSMLFFIALGLMVIGTVFVTRDAHSPVPSGTLA